MDPKDSPELEMVVKDGDVESFKPNTYTDVVRALSGRQVNFIAFAAAIGTTLFISIGSGLAKGGPLGLLLGYSFWTFIIYLLTTAAGEMTIYLPIHMPYLAFLGRTVDEALEVAAGFNFYLMYSLYIPFEITAVNRMIHYWRDDYSPVITLVIQIALYVAISVFAVRIYGEAEFWFAISKMVLFVGLLFFTFITMVGGNPKHDAFGFRAWRAEGGPLVEYLSTGASGRLQGLIGATINGSFTIIGPELLSAIAGEAQYPRGTKENPGTMTTAFKTVVYRLVLFYVLGSITVGILIDWNDPRIGTASNASASPYVIAMDNLGIKFLPHLVNAVIITAAFSAGLSFMFCSSRILYMLSKQGIVPRFFSITTKAGVPIYCVAMGAVFSLLSLMQLGTKADNALNYMIYLCTGSQVLNYVFMAIAYIGFYRACKAQGIDRDKFVYKSWLQPYSIYFALFFLVVMVGILGYTVFLPGMWSVDDFLFSYVMFFVSIGVFIAWKLIKRTKFRWFHPEDADMVTGLAEIEEHEHEFLETHVQRKHTWYNKVLDWLF